MKGKILARVVAGIIVLGLMASGFASSAAAQDYREQPFVDFGTNEVGYYNFNTDSEVRATVGGTSFGRGGGIADTTGNGDGNLWWIYDKDQIEMYDENLNRISTRTLPHADQNDNLNFIGASVDLDSDGAKGIAYPNTDNDISVYEWKDDEVTNITTSINVGLVADYGDLDNDGNNGYVVGDTSGNIQVVEPSGTDYDTGVDSNDYDGLESWGMLGDYDGDGNQEIPVATAFDTVKVINSTGGTVYQDNKQSVGGVVNWDNDAYAEYTVEGDTASFEPQSDSNFGSITGDNFYGSTGQISSPDSPPTINDVNITPASPNLNDDVDISADVTDDGSVSSVTANVTEDGNDLATGLTLTDGDGDDVYDLANAFTANKTGSYEVEIIAEDDAGQTTTDSSTTFTISNTAPTIDNVTRDPTSVLVNDQVDYNVTVSDSENNVDNVTVTVEEDGTTEVTDDPLTYDAGNDQYTYSFTADQLGNYNLTFTATDNDGLVDTQDDNFTTSLGTSPRVSSYTLNAETVFQSPEVDSYEISSNDLAPSPVLSSYSLEGTKAGAGFTIISVISIIFLVAALGFIATRAM